MNTPDTTGKTEALCGMFPLLRKVFARAGHFVSVLWVRPMKTRKGIDAIVTKEVRTTVRVGLAYDNRASVQTARASGELPSANAGLPWGQWEVFPYVISHNGGFYVRLYPVLRSDGSPRRCKVVYRENGQRITRERAQALCLASEFSETSDVTCYTLRAQTLQRVR